MLSNFKNFKKWGKVGLIALGAGLIVVGGLMSLYRLAYYQKVFPHVKVGEVDISNLSLNQVEKKLMEAMPKNLKEIRLGFGSMNWPIDLVGLEIGYLPRKTAERAFLGGRSQGWWENIKVKWGRWQNQEEIKMEFDINEEKLVETIELIAVGIEEEPIKPGLSLNEDLTVELIPGRSGRLVDRDKLKNQMLNSLGRLDFSQIEIPTELIKVEVSGDELAKTQERAEKLKTRSLQLETHGYYSKIEDQEILDSISFQSGFDEDKVASIAANLGISVDRVPQNAFFQFDGKRVVEFKPALMGLKVDQQEAKKTILEGLEKLEAGEEEIVKVKIEVGLSEPKIKTEQVNDLGIKELIGKGESTFYHSISGRVHNVALTAAKLNGILIPPGGVFSFNNSVGDISVETGFQSAYIIKDGRTVLGDGGGVCQDSTTLFRAILDAGLPILERKAHAYRVNYYEQNSKPGFDATVYNPTADLKFKNDTGGHILIQTKINLSSSYLAVELYGTKDGRISNISNVRLWGVTPPPADLYQDDPTLPAGTVKQVDWKAWGGKAAFDWKVTRGGEVLQERTFYSNYRPWQSVYLRGTGG